MFATMAIIAALASTSGLGKTTTARIYGAIWDDLQLNAVIGNGNWLGSLWYNAGQPGKPTLHIRDLECDAEGRNYRCTFALLRDGGPKVLNGESAPDRLACAADFERDPESSSGWTVRHLRPGRSGHSRTTMSCEASPPN